MIAQFIHSSRRPLRVLILCSAGLAIAFATTHASAQDFDRLLADYRAYGLPEPPKDAPLVRIDNGWRETVGNGKETVCRALGFLIKPAVGKKQAVVLVGTELFENSQDPDLHLSLSVVDPRTVSLNDIRGWWTSSAFDINVGLATALQCKARGWDDLARRLWDASINEGGSVSGEADEPEDARSFHLLGSKDPRHPLALTAWSHWFNELVRPDSDRKHIAIQIRKLLARQPKKTWRGDDILDVLDRTLAPSRARPGTLEAHVDQLVDDVDETSGYYYSEPSSAACRTLTLAGFDAVPVLLEHLDDPRLARHGPRGGSGHLPNMPLRVGDVASGILEGLSGEKNLGVAWDAREWEHFLEPLIKEPHIDLAERRRTAADSRNRVRQWFAKAQLLGEEKYLVGHALPVEGTEPNDQIVDVLEKKYPQELPALYRTLLDQRPEMRSDPLIERFEKWHLPKQQRIDLLLLGVRHRELNHRSEAISALRELDKTLFLKSLIKVLNDLPATPETTLETYQEAEFAQILTKQTDDPAAWSAAMRAASRAAIGLRMEMIAEITNCSLNEGPRRQRLEFLAGFLDDAAVRDWRTNPKFDQNSAGHDFPVLEVRNLAAMGIAEFFTAQIKDKPDPEWSPEQWTAYRQRVAHALRTEKALPRARR